MLWLVIKSSPFCFPQVFSCISSWGALFLLACCSPWHTYRNRLAVLNKNFHLWYKYKNRIKEHTQLHLLFTLSWLFQKITSAGFNSNSKEVNIKRILYFLAKLENKFTIFQENYEGKTVFCKKKIQCNGSMGNRSKNLGIGQHLKIITWPRLSMISRYLQEIFKRMTSRVCNTSL